MNENIEKRNRSSSSSALNKIRYFKKRQANKSTGSLNKSSPEKNILMEHAQKNQNQSVEILSPTGKKLNSVQEENEICAKFEMEFTDDKNEPS